MAAAVEDSGGGGGKGKKKKSKGVPPIDMTPMVDLGFLLLTFFILTTTMADPKTLPIMVPADKKEDDPNQTKVAESKVMNILIVGEDRIYYYMGKPATEGGIELNSINHGKGIRTKIMENAEKVRKKWRTKDDPEPMIIMIKMSPDAVYKNMVDIIDEMNITNQKKYMLIDLTKEEAEIISDYEKAQNVSPSSVTKTLAQ